MGVWLLLWKLIVDRGVKFYKAEELWPVHEARNIFENVLDSSPVVNHFISQPNMPRQRSKKLFEGQKVTQQPSLATKDNQEVDDSEFDSANDLDKDGDEEELDRLVLGDGAGFMIQLGKSLSNVEDQPSETALEAEMGLDEVGNLETVNDADLFFLDDSGAPERPNALMKQLEGDDWDGTDGEDPAWEDSDDDRLMISLAGDSRLRKLRVGEADDIVSGKEYTERLRQQFQILNPVPEWAIPSGKPAKRRRRSSASSDSSGVEDEDLSTLPLARLLQESSSISKAVPAAKRAKLDPDVIDIQRTRDIAKTQPSAVTSLSFHPHYPVLLSSGPASTLYLHQIAPGAVPETNPLITSVHVRSTPLSTSAFLGPDGSKIFFSGRRRYFHTWDLASGVIQKVTRVYGQKDNQRSMERFKLSPCGRYMGLVGSAKKGGGIVNILDANTTQWIAAARIEGRGGIADFAWWRDGEGLTIAGKGGELGEWSMVSRSFIALWNDDGAVGSTIISLGGHVGRNDLGGDRWVAIGSSSGIVNIYDRRPWIENGVSVPTRPKPTRQLMQLTTPTSCLQFSADGQILVVASRWKSDALKLVHLPSCTVYRNWPTTETPLGRVTAVAFSSGSDMLAVANENGKIRLWEIRRRS